MFDDFEEYPKTLGTYERLIIITGIPSTTEASVGIS
jgi:hypothetical protein